MEENVRKLLLTLAAGIAVLSTGALPSYADGVLPGPGTGYQPYGPAIYEGPVYETPVVQNVVHPGGMVCTHFWNGRWHHRQICFWAPQHRQHHQHHQRHHRFH